MSLMKHKYMYTKQQSTFHKNENKKIYIKHIQMIG